MTAFQQKLRALLDAHEALITRKNEPQPDGNGIYSRWKYPVVTAAHTPIFWRYDLNERTNPFLMERQGINATFNAGAMRWKWRS